MLTSAELFQQANAKLAEVKKIEEVAEADGNRDLTEEESTQVEALFAAHDDLKAKAERRLKLEQAEAAMGAPLPREGSPDPLPTDPTGLPQAPAQPRDQEAEDRHHFRDLGEFASCVMAASTPGNALDQRLIHYAGADGVPELQAAATGMQQAVPSDGGFMVPPTFSQSIWDGMNEAPDNLLDLVDVQTVQGQSVTFPANAETSRADGSRYGGVRGYWLAEAAQITASQPRLRGVKLEPHELAVLVYVTDKLLRNSPATLTGYLRRAAVDEINFLIGNAIINGTGAGQPLGILNAAATITAAAEGSQAADTFLQINVANMFSRLHARGRGNAVWLINQDVEPQIDLMMTLVRNDADTDSVGGFSAGLYNADRDTLKGRPIRRLEYCQTLGDVGDVILADLMGYTVGIKGGIRSAMSMHLRFDFAETAFRFMFEVDGQPWLASAITPFNGANTVSSFVTLAARA